MTGWCPYPDNSLGGNPGGGLIPMWVAFQAGWENKKMDDHLCESQWVEESKVWVPVGILRLFTQLQGCCFLGVHWLDCANCRDWWGGRVHLEFRYCRTGELPSPIGCSNTTHGGGSHPVSLRLVGKPALHRVWMPACLYYFQVPLLMSRCSFTDCPVLHVRESQVRWGLTLSSTQWKGSRPVPFRDG